MQNNSHIISEESKTGMNKKVSSNQFCHAMHTYGKDAIGTETMAAALQHSEVVAKKHYNSKESSAFPRFYDLVTAAKKTSDIEISDATDSETRTDQHENSSSESEILVTNKDERNSDEVVIDDWVSVTYDKWYLGQVREAENNVVVDFFEAVGENR